ncbi:cellulose synthase interactive 1-like protein [Tanacetum coccineum]
MKADDDKLVGLFREMNKQLGGGCNMEDPDGTLASVAQCIEQLQQISLSAQDNEYNLKQLLELIDTRRNAFTAVGSHSQAVPVLVSLLRSGSLGVKMQAATVFSKRVIALIFEMNVVFDVSAKSKVPFYSI